MGGVPTTFAVWQALAESRELCSPLWPGCGGNSIITGHEDSENEADDERGCRKGWHQCFPRTTPRTSASSPLFVFPSFFPTKFTHGWDVSNVHLTGVPTLQGAMVDVADAFKSGLGAGVADEVCVNAFLKLITTPSPSDPPAKFTHFTSTALGNRLCTRVQSRYIPAVMLGDP